MAQAKTIDAIALLKQDHREVEQLFAKYEKASAGGKQKIAEEVCNELKIHTMIEEEIFYPALEGKIDDDDVKEAYVEHDSAKVLINDIMSEDRKDDEYYDAKVKVLKEEVEHHIKEEEKEDDSLFAQARETDVDLKELGQQMAERKAELKKQAEQGALGPARTQAVTPLPM